MQNRILRSAFFRSIVTTSERCKISNPGLGFYLAVLAQVVMETLKAQNAENWPTVCKELVDMIWEEVVQ
jgi:hypothetical protein